MMRKYKKHRTRVLKEDVDRAVSKIRITEVRQKALRSLINRYDRKMCSLVFTRWLNSSKNFLKKMVVASRYDREILDFKDLVLNLITSRAHTIDGLERMRSFLLHVLPHTDDILLTHNHICYNFTSSE